MSNRKPKGGNKLGLLDDGQRDELAKFGKDLRTAMPHMQAAAQAAKRLNQAMIDAPQWTIVDAPKPDEPPAAPAVWTVGHAKINYVDEIKTEGTQDK